MQIALIYFTINKLARYAKFNKKILLKSPIKIMA